MLTTIYTPNGTCDYCTVISFSDRIWFPNGRKETAVILRGFALKLDEEAPKSINKIHLFMNAEGEIRYVDFNHTLLDANYYWNTRNTGTTKHRVVDTEKRQIICDDLTGIVPKITDISNLSINGIKCSSIGINQPISPGAIAFFRYGLFQ